LPIKFNAGFGKEYGNYKKPALSMNLPKTLFNVSSIGEIVINFEKKSLYD